MIVFSTAITVLITSIGMAWVLATETLRKGRVTMKLYDIGVGIIMGGVVGFVMAQSVDLPYAIIIGVIMGGSIAFGSTVMSTEEEHCGD